MHRLLTAAVVRTILLLIAAGAWLALTLQARSMGLMAVTMGIAMSSFVVISNTMSRPEPTGLS